MPRKMNEDTASLKRSIASQIGHYNRKMRQEGTPEYQTDLSTKGLRTKKELQKVQTALNREKKDPSFTNERGMKVTKSQVEKLKKTQERTNKRLQKEFEEQKEKREQIREKWGRPKPPFPVTREEERGPLKYTRGIDTFATPQEYKDYLKRLNLAHYNEHGHGEELKRRIIKAFGGEGYQIPGRSRVRGGMNNPLIKFIEEEMTPDEVEFFFEGHLNFDFSYDKNKTGYAKEVEISNEILSQNEYPELKRKWKSYAEQEHYDAYYQSLLQGVSDTYE